MDLLSGSLGGLASMPNRRPSPPTTYGNNTHVQTDVTEGLKDPEWFETNKVINTRLSKCRQGTFEKAWCGSIAVYTMVEAVFAE